VTAATHGAGSPAADRTKRVHALPHGFVLEWRRSRSRPRLFVMNVLIPLVLALPLAVGGAPRQHAAVVYAVLFTFFGTFGSAIPLLRDAERGMVRRISQLPIGAGPLLLGRALAGAALDSVQLAPACALVAFTSLSASATAWLVLVLPLTLVFTGLLGTWIAAVAQSVAEGALFAAVTVLLLLHASGTFRSPSPESGGALIERIAPFRALHELLLTGRTDGLDTLLITVAGVMVITVVIGRKLLRSLARADGRR